MPDSWITIDASLVVVAAVEAQPHPVGARLDDWVQRGIHLAAPSLFYYEALNALYQYEKLSQLSPAAIDEALVAIFALPLEVFGDRELHTAALDLTRRFSLPDTYDAHCLALAERFGSELWTADRRLFRAVREHLPWVRYAPDEARASRG